MHPRCCMPPQNGRRMQVAGGREPTHCSTRKKKARGLPLQRGPGCCPSTLRDSRVQINLCCVYYILVVCEPPLGSSGHPPKRPAARLLGGGGARCAVLDWLHAGVHRRASSNFLPTFAASVCARGCVVRPPQFTPAPGKHLVVVIYIYKQALGVLNRLGAALGEWQTFWESSGSQGKQWSHPPRRHRERGTALQQQHLTANPHLLLCRHPPL